MIAPATQATDLSVIVYDSISAADTVANAVRRDTFYTPWAAINNANRFQMFYTILADGSNPLISLADDSFLIKFQHSFDRINLRSWNVGQLGDTTIGTWGTVNFSLADSVVGNWGRGVIIHYDTAEADQPDSVGLVRNAQFNLWIGNKK